MNIWNKVFLGVIIAVSIAIVALASLEMKIRNTGLKHTGSLEARITKTNEDIAKIQAGTATEWGVDALRVALSERYSERGRAWFGGRVSGRPTVETLPPALTQVLAQVIITGPLVASEAGAQAAVVHPEHLMGVVYVFAEDDKGNIGAFLGRFNVDSVPAPAQFRDDEGNQIAGYRVTLITADPVGKGEIDLISGAAGSPWAIFMAPPIDRYAGIFDILTEEQKEALPPEMLEKFGPRPMPELTDEEKEGVSADVIAAWEKIRATMDDPEAGAAKDYTTVLDWLYERLSTARLGIHSTTVDIATLKASEDRIRTDNIQYKAEGDREAKRAAFMKTQRDAVETLLGEYQEEVNDLTLQAEKLQSHNEAHVNKIGEYQATAIELMEAQKVANAAREDE